MSEIFLQDSFAPFVFCFLSVRGNTGILVKYIALELAPRGVSRGEGDFLYFLVISLAKLVKTKQKAKGAKRQTKVEGKATQGFG